MVRVRFAPSPTGHLHIGGARTALFNWLYARHHQGTFILRIEDTDRTRSTEEYIVAIIDGMRWLKLDWDDGPYRQTDRFDIYRSYADRLLKEDKAYYCYCLPEELEQRRKEALSQGKIPKYDGRCRDIEKVQRFKGSRVQGAIRFKMPQEGQTVVDDLIKGKVIFENAQLDDLIIMRSDGTPTYNFVVVVDDVDMDITHVIRGDDHLNNTPKQIHIYKAFDVEPPLFAHLPMILGSDKTRLSKRHGATSVNAYRDMGYLPDALVNYLVRLGWSYGDQEVFSREELIKYFSFENIGKSAAVFNPKKLLWLNSQYIINTPSEKLAELVIPFLVKEKVISEGETLNDEWLSKAIGTLKERSRTLIELANSLRYYISEDIEYNEKAKAKFLNEKSRELLIELEENLTSISDFSAQKLEKVFKAIIEKHNIKLGDLAQPVRVAMTGGTESPGIFEVLEIVGKEKTLKRLEKAVKTIGISTPPSDFIRDIIKEDLKNNKNNGRVHTRFPPEPNGYLHIGHAKSICLNFGIAAEFRGLCNLRFDDTNPTKEEIEYVESIKEDVRWLGFDWGDRLFYASDYFEQMYQYAVQLIKDGKAYVCDLSADEIREYRGTLTEPGKDSPYRTRSVEENMELFEHMRAGKFPDGSRTLRAKIDMASGNLNMRDPVIYRILHTEHHRTGNKWCLYPTYDFAHCISDSIEGITHSICTLEFEDHRPLYDWFLDELKVYHPQQIEFARLNLSYTVLSKRKLVELVENGHVTGWDDPRMPTIAGLRRRGYTPESIRNFCERIGVAKRDSMVDMALLEHCIREDLNKRAPRVMAVLHPLRVVIDNYPEDKVEELEAINNPEDLSMGTRKVPFSRVLYIERDDFREDPPKQFFRLAPGREVRLRYAYFITCVGVAKDEQTGEVIELHCTYDPETRGGDSPDGRRVKATLHWVSAAHAIEAEVRLYSHLFVKADPDDVEEGHDFKSYINPTSLVTLKSCRVEPSLAGAAPGSRYQFERQGYFCVDSVDSSDEKLVFNRTVSLRDTWAKIEKALHHE